MCKGEVSSISVAPRFAFGPKGFSPHVPADAWVLYTVELLDFEQEKELQELSVFHRREIGNRKRERGNWWYGRGESALAVQCYRRALEFLDEAEGGISYPKADNPEEVRLVSIKKNFLLARNEARRLHFQFPTTAGQ